MSFFVWLPEKKKVHGFKAEKTNKIYFTWGHISQNFRDFNKDSGEVQSDFLQSPTFLSLKTRVFWEGIHLKVMFLGGMLFFFEFL